MKQTILKASLTITAMAVYLMCTAVPMFAGQMSIDEIKARWGEPASVVKMDDGVEKMIFGPKIPAAGGYAFYKVKDGQVIESGICGSLEKGEKAAPKTEQVALTGTMTSRYYETHPTSVEELKGQWGEPISNHDYDNGVKKLTFGPKLPDAGYAYFIVKDGMVVDRGYSFDK